MSASEKVTAYELALRLHNRRLEEVRSEEMASVAAENGLVVCYPEWNADTEADIYIAFLGDMTGGCPADSGGILHGTQVIALDLITDEHCLHVTADIPSVGFLIRTDDGDNAAYGLVISMTVFDELERETAAHTAQKHEAG